MRITTKDLAKILNRTEKATSQLLYRSGIRLDSENLEKIIDIIMHYKLTRINVFGKESFIERMTSFERARELFDETCCGELFKEVREEAGHKCTQCGSDNRVVIHHKNLDHFDNRKDNLVLLCAKCHITWHGKERQESKRRKVQLISIGDAVEHFRVSRQSINEWVNAGDIEIYYLGTRRYLVSYQQIKNKVMKGKGEIIFTLY